MAVTPPKQKPVWLSPAEVVARVPGLTEQKLIGMRNSRSGPAYYKPTLRTVLYLETEIDAWIAQSRVETSGGGYEE